MTARSSFQVGQAFGRWVIIGPAVVVRQRSHYPCRCTCGVERLVSGANLQAGYSRSCSCLGVENNIKACRTHGDGSYKNGRPRLYRIWAAMTDRCRRRNHGSYTRYGGRGIRVCELWRKSYAAFKAWALANDYADHLSLDRKDNDGNYCPENCRWVDAVTQGNNKRNSRWITAWGERKTLAAWGRDRRCAVETRCIHARLLLGWSPEKAINTPNRIKRYRRVRQGQPS